MRLGKPLNVSVPPLMSDIANVADAWKRLPDLQRHKPLGTTKNAKNRERRGLKSVTATHRANCVRNSRAVFSPS